MMLFSSFFFLPIVFFVFYSYRPTAAATTLDASPIKRRGYNLIECEGPLPMQPLPFPSLFDMCAARAGFPGNFKCECIGPVLVCGRSLRLGVQVLLRWCYRDCECGPITQVSLDARRTDLDHAPVWNFDYVSKDIVKKEDPFSPNPQTSPSGNHPTGNTRTCSGTCRSVDHGCNQASKGDCKCFAPPVSLLYWHQGDCGTRLPFKAKRDLVQQRHSYYRNATAQFASSDKVTSPAGPLPDHAAQLASGLLPCPCNASYVSFACSDSADGIVHEPPQNWLGALVPEGAKELPPVPKEFLRIHDGREEKMQVLRPAMDEGGLGLG